MQGAHVWRDTEPGDWGDDIARFHAGLAALDG
jgi:hypothetical protein